MLSFDTKSVFIEGLSSFWRRLFKDTDVIDQLYAATEEQLSEVLFDLYSLVASRSLRSTPVVSKKNWRLLKLNSAEIFSTGDVTYPHGVKLTSDLVEIPFLYNEILNPTQVLVDNVDFTLTSEAVLQFKVNPFGVEQDFPQKLEQDGSTTIAVWAPVVYLDPELLGEVYGTLIDQYQPSSEMYKSFIEGALKYYLDGPTPHALEGALNLIVNIPVVSTDGEVLQSFDAGYTAASDRIVTDKHTYLIPSGTAKAAIQDPANQGVYTFRAFEALTDLFEVKDTVTDPNWWYGILLPKTLMEAGHLDRFVDTSVYDQTIGNPANSALIGDLNLRIATDYDGKVNQTGRRNAVHHKAAFELTNTVLKHNLAAIRVKTNTTYLPNSEHILDIINAGKPCNVYIYTLVQRFLTDTIEFDDSVTQAENLLVDTIDSYAANVDIGSTALKLGTLAMLGGYFALNDDGTVTAGYAPSGTPDSSAGEYPLIIGGDDPTKASQSVSGDFPVRIKIVESAPPPPPPTPESELMSSYPLTLVNPDAESNTGGAEVAVGWTHEVGSMSTRSTASTPPAHSGDLYFYGGITPTATASQNVDLLTITGLTETEIATKKVTVVLKWWQSSFGGVDMATLGVRGKAADGTILNSKYGKMMSTSPPENWYKREETVELFPGTTNIDIVAMFERSSGTNSDGYIDDIEATVYVEDAVVPTATTPRHPLDANTVALWRFDEGTDEDLIDEVGNATVSGTGESTFLTHIEGAAKTFADAGYQGPTNAAVRTTLMGEFTLELWLRHVGQSGTYGHGTLFQFEGIPGTSESVNKLFALTLNTDDELNCEWESNGTLYNAFNTPPTISRDRWHHIAVRKVFSHNDGSIDHYYVETFVDGTLVDTGTPVPNTTGGESAELGIGKAPFGDKYYYGDLDDMRFSSGLRTDAEIQARFTDIPDYWYGFEEPGLSANSYTNNYSVTAYNSSYAPDIVTGVVGAGRRFSGDALCYLHNGTADLWADATTEVGKDITLSFWTRAMSGSNGSFPHMVAIQNRITEERDIAVVLDTATNSISVNWTTAPSTWEGPGSSSAVGYALPLNDWVHIAVRRSVDVGGTGKAYTDVMVNNTLLYNGENDPPATATATDWTISLGGGTATVSEGFNGDLDNIKIYHSAVADTVIAQDYNEGLAALGDAVSSDYAQAVLTDTPVVYWPLNEESGITALDYSGNNNYGTLQYPSTDYGMLGYPDDFIGEPTYLMNDPAQTLTSINNCPVNGAMPRTVEFWVKPLTTSTSYSLLWFGQPANNQLFSVGISSGNIEVWGYFHDRTLSAPVVGDDWHHIAVTAREDGTIQAVVDGVASPGVLTTPYATATSPLCIGPGDTIAQHERVMAHVAIYDKVLPLVRMQEHYYAARPAERPPAFNVDADTLALYSFRTASLADRSTNSLDLTNPNELTVDGSGVTSTYGPSRLYNQTTALVEDLRGEYAVEAWVYLDPDFDTKVAYNHGARSTLLAYGDAGTGQENIYLAHVSVDASRRVQWTVEYWNGAKQSNVVTAPSVLPVGEWVHLGLTKIGGAPTANYRIFINGVYAVTGVGYFSPGASDGGGPDTELMVGGEEGISRGWIGKIADIRITGRSRTDNELIASYDTTKASFGI